MHSVRAVRLRGAVRMGLPRPGAVARAAAVDAHDGGLRGSDARSRGDLRGLLLRRVRRTSRTRGERLGAVTAVLEFLVLVAGLFCMLLRLPAPAIWMLVGTVILIAGDMAFSVDVVPKMSEVVWMLGQFLLLAAVLTMARRVPRNGRPGAVQPAEAGSQGRSGIGNSDTRLPRRGPVSPLVWLLPVGAVWKSFCSALFVVSLVVVLVWITDRFDDTVKYLRSYVRRCTNPVSFGGLARLAVAGSGPRCTPRGLGASSTNSATRARDSGGTCSSSGRTSFWATPRPWRLAADVVLPRDAVRPGMVRRRPPYPVDACEALGVRAVRGDDLFTPTDFLEESGRASTRRIS